MHSWGPYMLIFQVLESYDWEFDLIFIRSQPTQPEYKAQKIFCWTSTQYHKTIVAKVEKHDSSRRGWCYSPCVMLMSSKVHGSLMVTLFPTSSLLRDMKHAISPRWIANPTRGCSHFPHFSCSLYQYLISYQSPRFLRLLFCHISPSKSCSILRLEWFIVIVEHLIQSF